MVVVAGAMADVVSALPSSRDPCTCERHPVPVGSEAAVATPVLGIRVSDFSFLTLGFLVLLGFLQGPALPLDPVGLLLLLLDFMPAVLDFERPTAAVGAVTGVTFNAVGSVPAVDVKVSISDTSPAPVLVSAEAEVAGTAAAETVTVAVPPCDRRFCCFVDEVGRPPFPLPPPFFILDLLTNSFSVRF
jgi:hypothetical protein